MTQSGEARERTEIQSRRVWVLLLNNRVFLLREHEANKTTRFQGNTQDEVEKILIVQFLSVQLGVWQHICRQSTDKRLTFPIFNSV